jgi:dimethylargininase
LGRDVYVGRSGRTNEPGAAALREHLEPLGYRVRPVDVGGCLHLKSAVTRIGPRTLLLNPRWVDGDRFGGWRSVTVDPAEPFAANALAVGDRVLYADAYPGTRSRLEEAGCDVLPVTVSELAKAEGGVTCCSLVFPA